MNKLNKNNAFNSFLGLALTIFASCQDGCGATKTEYVDREVPGQNVAPESQDVKEVVDSIRQCLAKYEQQHIKTVEVINPTIDGFYLDEDKLRDINGAIKASINKLKDLFGSAKAQDKIFVKELNDQMMILSESYDQLQESLVALRTKEFIESKPNEFDGTGVNKNTLFKKLLPQVFVEKFSDNQQTLLIQIRLKYLQALKKSLQSKTFINDEDQANPCHGMKNLPFEEKAPLSDLSIDILNEFIKKHEEALAIAAFLDTPSDGSGKAQPSALRTELIKQIDALTTTKSYKDFVFFPGGSKTHAMLYQIVKHGADNYSFRVFNSGDASGTHHTRVVVGYEIQVLPFIELSNLTKEQLTSITFVAFLSEFYDSNANAEFLYTKILPTLGGKTSVTGYGADELKSFRSGSSSYLALPWLLSVSFGNKSFAAQLEQLIGQKVLHDYVTEKVGGTDADLQNRAVKYLSIDALDRAKESTISPGFLRVAAVHAEKFSKDITPLDTPDDSGYNTNVAQKIEVKANINFTGYDQQPAAPGMAALGRAQDVLPEPPNNPMANLQAARNAVETAFNKGGDHDATKQYKQQLSIYIRKLVESLPLEKNAASWAPYKNQFDQYISFLKDIQHRYAQIVVERVESNTDKTDGLSTTEFLVILKLMSLGDMLNQTFANGVSKLPSLQQPVINEILFKNLSVVEIPDPKWQEEWAALKEYYKDKKDEETSFFGFDKNSAGKSEVRTIIFNSSGDNEADLNWAIDYLKAQPGYGNWLTTKKKNTPVTSIWGGQIYEIEPYIFGYENYPYGKQFSYTEYPKGELAQDRQGYVSDGYGGQVWQKIEGKSTNERLITHSKNLAADTEFDDIPRHKDKDNLTINRKEAALMLVDSELQAGNQVNAPHTTYKNQLNQNEFKQKFVLPKHFFDLRQMSYLVNYLLTGKIDLRANTSDRLLLQSSGDVIREADDAPALDQRGKEISAEYNDYSSMVLVNDRLVYTDKQVRNRIMKRSFVDKLVLSNKIGKSEDALSGIHLMAKRVMPFYTYQSASGREKELDENASSLTNIYSDGYDTDRSSVRGFYDMTAVPKRRVIAPNEMIVNNFKSVIDARISPSMTLEGTREIFSLSGIEENQVTEVLGYFSANSGNLSKEEYQRLFEKLMLAPNLLLNELKHNELESYQFVRMLANFCENNFNRFEKDEETKEVVFFARMNHLFKIYVEFATGNNQYKIKNTDNLAGAFFDSAQALRNYIGKISLSSARSPEIGLVYLTLANLYTYVKRELTNDEVADILAAKIYLNNKTTYNEDWLDQYRTDETADILLVKRADIVRVMNDNAPRNNVLKKVAQRITGRTKNNWQPIVSGLWAGFVGLSAGQKEAKYKSGDGPDDIQIDVFLGTLTDGGAKQVPFPGISKEEKERVFGQDPIPEHVKHLGGTWYESDDGDFTMQIQNNTILSFIKNGLYLMKEADAKKMFDDMILPAGMQYWKDTNANGSIAIYARDRGSFDNRYEATIDQGKLQSVIQSREGKRLELLQVDKASDEIKIFTRIEEAKFIDVWVDKSEATVRLLEISLPRLGLKFKPLAKDTTKLDCANDKYLIAPSKIIIDGKNINQQYAKYLTSDNEYIICAKENPDEKIANFIGLMVLPKNLMNTPDGDRVLTYEISKLDEPVKPINNAAAFYLAYKKLAEEKYDQAKSLLLGSDIYMTELNKSKHEDKILRAIIEVADQTPEGIALRLLAFSMMLYQKDTYRNIDDTEFPSDGEKNILFDIYPKYLSTINHSYNLMEMRNNALDFYQEYLLAVEANKINPTDKSDAQKKNTAATNTKFIQNRLAVLNKMHPAGKDALGKDLSAIALEKDPQKLKKEAKIIKDKNFQNNILQRILGLNTPGAFTLAFDEKHCGSLLEQPVIFEKADKFKLFYYLAIDQQLGNDEAELALNILAELTKAPKDSLDKNKLRAEFVKLFSISALAPGGEGNDIAAYARFFELTAKYVDGLSSSEQKKFRDQLVKYLDDVEKAGEARIAAQKAYNTIQYPALKMIKGKYSYDPEETNKYHTDRNKASNKQKIVERRLNDYNVNILADYVEKIPQESLAPVSIDTPVSLEKTAERSPYRIPSSDSSNRTPALGESTILVDPFKTPYLASTSTDFTSLFDEQALLTTQYIDELKEALIKKLTPQAISNATENIRNSVNALVGKIRDYADSTLKSEMKFVVKSGVNFAILIAKLDDSMTLINDQANAYKGKIDKLVDLGDDADAQFKRMSRWAELEHKYSIDEMIYLLLNNNLAELKQVMVGKKDEQSLDKLAQYLSKYLVNKTYYRHLSSCKDAVSELDKAIQAHKDTQEIQLLSDKAASLLKDIRNYDVRDHVEYLVFEYFNGISLRKDQVEALEGLSLKPDQMKNEKALGPLREIIMGFGKTKVLLPILSVLNTKDPDALNIIMLPEALVTSMAKELKKLLEDGFDRSIDTLEIHRGTKLDKMGLDNLYDRLMRAQKEKRNIITTNSSMQSLFLLLTEKLENYGQVSNDEIDRTLKIFRFLRKYGRLNVDEVDMAMDVLKSHQFSVGRAERMRESITATVFSFYRMLSTDDDLRNLFIFKFVKPTYDGTPAVFTTASYKESKATIITKVVNNKDFLKGFPSVDQAYGLFVKDGQNQQALNDYLMNTSDLAREDLFKKIDQSSLKSHEKSLMKDIASVLYEEINVIFEVTASKKLGIHYGAQKPVGNKELGETQDQYNLRKDDYENSKFIAVPLTAGASSPGSRFGSDIEASNYTMQRALEELNFNEQLSIEKTQLLKKNREKKDDISKQQIADRVWEIFFNHVKSIRKIDQDDINDAAIELRKPENIARALELIKDHTLPQLKTYKTQLFTSAQIYGSMFKVVLGFSGTLWSIDTFPDIFEKGKLSDTTAKTFMLLYQQFVERGPGKGIRTINELDGLGNERSPQELLGEIYPDDFDGSLIELAGMLRAAANKDIAQLIKDKNPARNEMGVDFYDAEENLAVLGPNGVLPLENTTVNEKDRVAYWDKKHTTGSDLKLRPNMQAIMTFDQHTFARDIEQSVWRLRQLAKGQKIAEYVVFDNDLNLIVAEMNTILKTEDLYNTLNFDVGDMLFYGVLNQEKRLGDLKHRGLRYRMNNAVVEKVFKRMLDGSAQDAVAVYRSFSHLFRRNLDKDPHTYVGLPVTDAPKAQVLQKNKRELVEPLRSALSNWGMGQVDGTMDDLISKAESGLPENLPSRESGGLDVSVQMQQEINQEQVQITYPPMKTDDNFNAHAVLKWKKPEGFDSFAPISYSEFGATDISKSAKQPLFEMREALVKKESSAFNQIDKDLLGSLNFAPLHAIGSYASPKLYKFGFFRLYQKKDTSLLVIVNPAQGTDDSDHPIKLVMIDGEDELQIRKLIAEMDKEAEPSFKMAIYKIGLGNSVEAGFERRGIIRQLLKNRINEDYLRDNPQFIKLLAQAKFLNGELSYSKEEQNELVAWLDLMSDSERMFMAKTFKDKILEFRFLSEQAFPESDIKQVFIRARAQ